MPRRGRDRRPSRGERRRTVDRGRTRRDRVAETQARDASHRHAEMIARRDAVSRELGEALAASAAAAESFAVQRPIIEVGPGDEVAVRMAKRGVIYSFALNRTPLPYNDSHVYPLILSPGINGLVWTVSPTKAPWAYEVDIAINGQAYVLDRAQWQLGAPAPDPQQQVIRVSM